MDKLIYGLARWVYICPYCGKEAFYLIKKPEAGEIIVSDHILNLDFISPPPKSSAMCGNCNSYYSVLQIERIKPVT